MMGGERLSNNNSQDVVIVEDTSGKNKRLFTYEELMAMRYATLAKHQIRNLSSTTDSNPTYNKYTKEQLITYLGNPASSEKQLRQMSKYLYNISNYYRRLIRYLANMHRMAYVVSPYNVDYTKKINDKKFYTAYQQAVNKLEVMNIKHEFSKVLTIAFRDDVFYGYTFETNDSFTIQTLDADYCKISSVEDGVFNFAFDFSYFDSNKDKLPNYAPEFETMYNLYKSKGTAFRWQELDPNKSICIKINEQDYIPIPPFVSLFSALADIEDYRAITKSASETNNYKALAMEIPIDPKNGSFLIDKDMAVEFYNMLTAVLPPNIGAILTPMPIKDWTFERSGAMADTDDVSKAEASMWAQAGVNQLLFGGGDDPSASTLELSTVNDQTIVFTAVRQIERWINRRLKQLNGQYMFKIVFLDVTEYNKDSVHASLLKDGQYGLPVRSAIMATNGFTPADTQGLAYIENTILKLSENEIPLVSSNTQSSDNEGGRPTNASKGESLTDSGENSQEQDLSTGG